MEEAVSSVLLLNWLIVSVHVTKPSTRAGNVPIKLEYRFSSDLS